MLPSASRDQRIAAIEHALRIEMREILVQRGDAINSPARCGNRARRDHVASNTATGARWTGARNSRTSRACSPRVCATRASVATCHARCTRRASAAVRSRWPRCAGAGCTSRRDCLVEPLPRAPAGLAASHARGALPAPRSARPRPPGPARRGRGGGRFGDGHRQRIADREVGFMPTPENRRQQRVEQRPRTTSSLNDPGPLDRTAAARDDQHVHFGARVAAAMAPRCRRQHPRPGPPS